MHLYHDLVSGGTTRTGMIEMTRYLLSVLDVAIWIDQSRWCSSSIRLAGPTCRSTNPLLVPSSKYRNFWMSFARLRLDLRMLRIRGVLDSPITFSLFPPVFRIIWGYFRHLTVQSFEPCSEWVYVHSLCPHARVTYISMFSVMDLIDFQFQFHV